MGTARRRKSSSGRGNAGRSQERGLCFHYHLDRGRRLRAQHRVFLNTIRIQGSLGA